MINCIKACVPKWPPKSQPCACLHSQPEGKGGFAKATTLFIKLNTGDKVSLTVSGLTLFSSNKKDTQFMFYVTEIKRY